MSYSFGNESKQHYNTLHPKLKKIADALISHVDCKIMCGHRSNEEQARLLAAGVSKVGPGKSKHNSLPSRAMDIGPYPVDWNDRERWLLWCGFVKGTAAALGIEIRMGADWDMDGYTNDQKFHDMPHIELSEDEV